MILTIFFNNKVAAMAAAVNAVLNNNITLLIKTKGNDNDNNNTFIDSSTNLLTITRNGNVTQGSVSPFSPFGWSGYFTVLADKLNIPTIPAIGTDKYCIEFFVYPTVAPGNNAYWFMSPSSFIIGTATGVWGRTNQGSWSGSTTTTTFPTLNTWNHIAVVRDGTGANQCRLYLNGKLMTTSTDGWTHVATTLMLGNTVKANYSNLRIVKGDSVYTTDFTPPTEPLTAIPGTCLLTLQDNRFKDNSTNNFTLTVTGTVKAQSFSPFISNIVYSPSVASGSVYFNGTSDFVFNNSLTQLNNDNWTIECYISPIAQNPNTGFFQLSSVLNGFQTGAAWLNSIALVTENSKIRIYINSGAYTSTVSTLLNNVWQHVAIVKNNNEIRVYFNGILDTSLIFADSFNYTGQSLVIGGGYSTDYLTNSNISNFRIVKGVAVYTSNFTPSESPLTNISGTTLLTLQDSYFKDNSNNDLTLSINGNPSFQSSNPFNTSDSYSSAIYGGSAYFDGASYLSTLSTNAVAFGTGDFTIEFWVYPTQTTVTRQDLIDINSSFDNVRLLVYYTGTVIAYYNATSNKISGTTLLPNVWTHISLCRSSGITKLFINGTMVGSQISDTTNYPAQPLYIGKDRNGITYVTGNISSVRILKGRALYTSNFIPSVNALTTVPDTSLLFNFTNAGIYDAVGKSNIETVGTAKVSTGILNKNLSNISFDGSASYLANSYHTGLEVGSGDFTIECFFNISNISGFKTLFAFMADFHLGIFIKDNIPMMFASSNGSTWDILVGDTGSMNGSGTAIITPNVWHHLAMVRSGNIWTLFINGNINKRVTATGTVITRSENFCLGRWGNNSYFMNGHIEGFAFIKGKALYLDNFIPDIISA